MADELRRLSKTELDNALKRRLRGCPMCGENAWAVRTDMVTMLPTADDPNGPLDLHAIEDEHSVAGVMTTVPTICSGCGFVAQFFYKSLAGDTDQPKNGSH